MKVKQVHSTTVTVPNASQRPVPLKQKTPPTNNTVTSPVKSWKPIAQAPPCDNPQLPPRAQSLPQSVVKHTVVDLPAGKTRLSRDEHPMKLADKQFVNPKRKPIPLPVAQQKPKQNVDVNEQLSMKSLQVGLDELSSRVKKLETHCRQLQLQNQLSVETNDYKGGPDKHTQELSSFNPTMVSSRMIKSSLRL